jgi:hypothetical protein
MTNLTDSEKQLKEIDRSLILIADRLYSLDTVLNMQVQVLSSIAESLKHIAHSK